MPGSSRILITGKSKAPLDDLHLSERYTESTQMVSWTPARSGTHPFAVSDRGRSWTPRQRGVLPLSIPGQSRVPRAPLWGERTRLRAPLHLENAAICSLPQLANSRCTWCPSAPAFRAPRPKLLQPALPGGAVAQGHRAVTWGRQGNSTRIPTPASRPPKSPASPGARRGRASARRRLPRTPNSPGG